MLYTITEYSAACLAARRARLSCFVPHALVTGISGSEQHESMAYRLALPELRQVRKRLVLCEKSLYIADIVYDIGTAETSS